MVDNLQIHKHVLAGPPGKLEPLPSRNVRLGHYLLFHSRNATLARAQACREVGKYLSDAICYDNRRGVFDSMKNNVP